MRTRGLASERAGGREEGDGGPAIKIERRGLLPTMCDHSCDDVLAHTRGQRRCSENEQITDVRETKLNHQIKLPAAGYLHIERCNV